MERCIRVLIVDDLERPREGLRALLATYPQIEVIGEAADGLAAARLVETGHPDVVLMDVRMLGMDGIEATQQIKNRWPAVRVITLTIYGERRADALAAGSDAFLLKGCPSDELLTAILA
ncbi:MAG: response regulator transcription factor [Anaerolineae bacterium]|nr:response regulator transcription factor [Anaerolineae bacterium]